jgi:Legionella pneumophila major outer membrane protein precursor
MKKIILSALAVGGLCSMAGQLAHAGQNDDMLARLNALEKENAAIRRENAALQDNKTLRARNTELKSSVTPTVIVTQPALPASPQTVVSAAPVINGDVFGAYAADLPAAYKAPVESRGQFRFWGEAGAMLSGGDPNSADYNLLGGLGPLLAGGVGGIGSIDLSPKIGWETAAGFDYRFAGSPWHLSGQFRYGESGKASGSVSAAGAVDPVVAQLIFGGGNPLPAGFSSGASDAFSASYQETHWLADLAVGRDVIGSGPDAMQVKGGIRIAELVGTSNSLDATNFFLNGIPINLGVPVGNSISFATATSVATRNSYFGVGPRVGIEGSVPLVGSWTFDYLGDAAVLFGNQKQTTKTIANTSVSPAILGVLGGLGGGLSSITTTNDQRYATVFNGDIQIGVSYLLTHNVKLSASYRLDAFVNATDDAIGAMPTVNRYIHGPHLGVSGTF